MTDFISRAVKQIPPLWTALVIVAAAVTFGWSVRGLWSQQAGLPEALAEHVRTATDTERRYDARIQELERRQDALERRLDSIDERLDRSLCYVQALAQERHVGACAR